MNSEAGRICLVLLALVFVLLPSSAFAGQSTITEGSGYSCMGADKSRKQTESEALAGAKRNAVENASTYIKSETHIKDFQLEKELIDAYAKATVKVVQNIESTWYRDPALGDCFRVKIKGEVIPDESAMKQETAVEDPDAPLRVQVWTDKKNYKNGEKIRIYMKGNKPFFARVLYKDAQGSLVQLLPNPHRSDNYFNGGIVYQIPSGTDKFDLEVSPPFGAESVVVYAGTEPLGEVGVKASGPVYEVNTKPENVGMQTRGIKFTEKGKAASGFYETSLSIKTGK